MGDANAISDALSDRSKKERTPCKVLWVKEEQAIRRLFRFMVRTRRSGRLSAKKIP